LRRKTSPRTQRLHVTKHLHGLGAVCLVGGELLRLSTNRRRSLSAGGLDEGRLSVTVTFEPIDSGTRVIERVRIAAPRPLAAMTMPEAVNAARRRMRRRPCPLGGPVPMRRDHLTVATVCIADARAATKSAYTRA